MALPVPAGLAAGWLGGATGVGEDVKRRLHHLVHFGRRNTTQQSGTKSGPYYFRIHNSEQ